MKYIKKVNTEVERDGFILSSDYCIPSVIYTDNSGDLRYESLKNGTPKLFDLGDGNFAGAFLLGAHFPSELGKVFAGGETSPKETYTGDNYKFGGPTSFTKYNEQDRKTQLDLEDDPATVLLGNGGRTMNYTDVRKYIGAGKIIRPGTNDKIALPPVSIGTSTLDTKDISKFRGVTARGILNVYPRNGATEVYFVPIYTPPV